MGAESPFLQMVTAEAQGCGTASVYLYWVSRVTNGLIDMQACAGLNCRDKCSGEVSVSCRIRSLVEYDGLINLYCSDHQVA